MPHHPHHHHRGTALFEALLALPFIMLILLFVVYFGQGSVRVQRTQVMDRYQAWQEAGHGPGPSANDLRGNTQLNDTFYDNTGDGIRHSGHQGFPTHGIDRWIDDTRTFDDDAGQLAEEMHEQMARGRHAHFNVHFEHNNKLLQKFEGPIRHGHTVQDHDWRYRNGYPRGAGAYDLRGPGADNLDPLKDTFYLDFHDALPDNAMSDMIKGLYLGNPTYRGPEVE